MATAVKVKTNERSEKSASGGIVCQVGALRDALGRVKLAAKRNAADPLSECVWLEAVDGKLQLDCGSEFGISTTVSVIKFELLECIVSAERLLGILKTLHAASDVLLKLNGTSLKINCNHSEWILQTVGDPSSEPVGKSLPQKKLPLFGRFIGEHLVRMLHHVSFACEEHGNRYSLGGVFFERTKNDIVIVATDGYRVCAEVLDNDGGEVGIDCILPLNAVQVLSRVAGAGSVSMTVGPHGAMFVIAHDDGEETVVSSPILDGLFPKWRKTLPCAVVSSTTLSRDSFLSAVRQAAITTSEESKAVTITVEGNTMVILSLAPEVGNSFVNVDVVSQGPCVTIKIDPSRVVDWLSSLDVASTVVMELCNEKTAMVLKSDTATCVVMPISKE
jgi:DNA polymerase III subunit beta